MLVILSFPHFVVCRLFVTIQQYSLCVGITDTCSRACQHALIALLSTPEGERLMECRCTDADCAEKKRRVEPCRAAVTWQNAPNSLVSCSAASWICAADPLCATALDYYNRNCQAMFKGRKCSRRCRNSLDILLRQPTAAKLATCYCDGTEDFECAAIRENTDVLCFGKKTAADKDEEATTTTAADDDSVNEIDDGPVGPVKSGAAGDRRGGSLVLAIFSLLVSYLLPQSVDTIRTLLSSIVI